MKNVDGLKMRGRGVVGTKGGGDRRVEERADKGREEGDCMGGESRKGRKK